MQIIIHYKFKMNLLSHLNSNKREDNISRHSSLSTIDVLSRSPANSNLNSRVYFLKNRQQQKYSSNNLQVTLQYQNKSVHQETQYLLNQLQILNERMEKKWEKSQYQIDQMYKHLKDIQKQLAKLIKQESKYLQTKQYIKIIGQKLHQLHASMSEQLTSAQQSLKKNLHKFSKEQQYIQSMIKAEQKQSQKCWQQAIDVLGAQILQIQNIIYQNKLQSQSRYKNFQSQLWKAQNNLKMMFQRQKKQTQSQHEIIIKLIENACNNLVLL